MNRRLTCVIGGAATAAVLVSTLQGPATASPPARPDSQSAKARSHDRHDAMEAKRRELNKRAAEMVLRGQRDVRTRGDSRAVRVAPGQWAQYGVQNSDEILSFLVEFGDQADPRFADAPAGPLQNQIPRPDRTVDNSTYWKPNFSRQHYLDMFFNGLPDQNGESFKDYYEEISSGRYTVDGDVSDWVRVPHSEASYGTTESNIDMTRFIDDSAEAWLTKAQQTKSPAEIKRYLARFDQWDRYDHDGDGDFAEPDGYVDHFQAIHAGEGEEAGAPEWTIWSHRWAANTAGTFVDGPADAPFGGVEIGNTGMWIRDYTTEPENGGLGVFTHEYGHDLGLPDLYDTAGGENGTGFWTLMSSGSWLSHGGDAIGTTPDHMGPWEKFQLGWLDYDVARAGTRSTHKLGPSYHATKKAQAVITILPKKTVIDDLGDAAEGDDYFYSGRGDNRTSTLTSPEFTVPAGADLEAKVNYEIELDWDYAYAEISTDGTTFTPLHTNLSVMTDPNGQNDGHGITGTSQGDWVGLTADLAAYEGKSVQIRFRMFNDASYNEIGFKVDDIRVGTALTEGAEDGAPGWVLDEFVIAENGMTDQQFSHYYIAENRQYLGYDTTLRQGPYNFGWGITRPNWVEHFPYQNGLLVWYWNTQYADNNTSQHPGGGEVLPVDALAKALRWSDGTVARSRIQVFDATFGLERTDPLVLHRETAAGMTTVRVPSRPGVPVFNDSNPNAYYDPAAPQSSVQVGGTGVRIEVVSSNRNAMMTVRVY